MNVYDIRIDHADGFTQLTLNAADSEDAAAIAEQWASEHGIVCLGELMPMRMR
jgi:hypothetical protein